MIRYSLSPRAESDLDVIWMYYAQFDPENANRFVREIIEIFEMIARNPSAGRVRNEFRENLRSFPKDAYSIFYYPKTTGVRIMRVLHTARDNETIIDEEVPN